MVMHACTRVSRVKYVEELWSQNVVVSEVQEHENLDAYL